MDDRDSLRGRYRSKIAIIRSHLRSAFPDDDVRESEDFDRDGIVFRTGKGAVSGFRFFVSHELFSDLSESALKSQLQSWGIKERLRNLPAGITLFLTTAGVFEERTSGDTLREVTGVFESVLPFSEQRKQLYDRVFAIRVDDVPLGSTATEMQGDPEVYITYSEEFANALGAAYLLDAAGKRDFELRRTPALYDLGINFEVAMGGSRALLDFKRAINLADRRAAALREQVNVGLRLAMRDDPVVRAAVGERFIQVTLPSAPQSVQDVAVLLMEIRRFVTSTSWGEFEKNALVAFDEQAYPLLSSLGARVYVGQNAPYLSVTSGATWSDPHAPYREAVSIIGDEWRRAALWPQAIQHPIWLGISMAEAMTRIASSNLLESIQINTEGMPFDEIIVGSAEAAKVFSKPKSLQSSSSPGAGN
jgi:hypothetical protein